LLAVDANIETRYKRIVERSSETDKISFEEFVENEKHEMESTDPNKQNLSKCIAMADFLINNDSNLQDLHDQIEKIVTKNK
jgi:dephospho-CoA kinase